VPQQVKDNYALPATVANLAEMMGIVSKADPDMAGRTPVPAPAEFVQDTASYGNLSKVKLSSSLEGDLGTWAWLDGTLAPELGAKAYAAVYTPADAKNYNTMPGTATLTVLPRSTEAGLALSGGYGFDDQKAGACGADTVQLQVRTLDPNARVWFADNEIVSGKFTQLGLQYGLNTIAFQVQPQAYDPKLRKSYTVDYARYIPFNKVASFIRSDALAIKFDKSLETDAAFFDTTAFTQFEIFEGGASLGVNKGTQGAWPVPNTGTYTIKLTTANGEYLTCASDGGYPAKSLVDGLDPAKVTPALDPDLAGLASFTGAKLAAAGSLVRFATPNGGTVGVYTLQGKLVMSVQAERGVTEVRLPEAQGVYVVKFNGVEAR
jgi:hypothetical protein